MVKSRVFAKGKVQFSNYGLVLGSFASAATFVIALCLLFEPRWETNDDIGMSMVAHGYGIAASGSPNLIFSNVIWGELVRAIPEINGILGYSIATISVLVIVGTVVVYGLLRLGVGYACSLSALALILSRPVLFPQFTINAGLLMVGAIISWHLYERQKNLFLLLVGCLLAFCSYLVRSQEFLLVLIVALPLLPWKTILLDRSAQTASLALIATIAISAVIDIQAYQGDEWKSFNELNPVRASFTDFKADEYLKLRPDILQQNGYSKNDIDLVRNWFFVDPDIADPKALKTMLNELGPLPAQGNVFTNAWIAVQALWHPNLLKLVLAALLLAVVCSSWQVTASWGLCITSVFVLGLLGRPGVLRVYVPLVCLLLIAPFLKSKLFGWRKHLVPIALTVAAIVNASQVFSESRISQATAERVRQELVTFPTSPVVVWGAAFPFENVYPVLGSPQTAIHYQFYGLGVFTLAPFSVAEAEQRVGQGLKDLIVSDKGVPIIAKNQRFRNLGIYCKQHLQGKLKELSTQNYGGIFVSRRRCEVAE